MLVNYAVILHTRQDIQNYLKYFLTAYPHRPSGAISQYLDDYSSYKYPLIVGIDLDGFAHHQGITTLTPTVDSIYQRHYSSYPLIPLQALLEPNNYPEYYI